jgi:hypothetical protein
MPMLMDLGEVGDRKAQFITGNLLAGIRMGDLLEPQTLRERLERVVPRTQPVESPDTARLHHPRTLSPPIGGSLAGP